MANKKDWREKYKEKDSSEEESSNSNWRDKYKEYNDYNSAKIVGEKVTNMLDAWQKNYNSYVTDYTKRLSGRKGNYEDAFVNDSLDWLNAETEKKAALRQQEDEIIEYLNEYGGHLDSKWVKQVFDYINQAKDAQYRIHTSATKDNEYWSSFGTDELLKKYGSAEEAYKYYQRTDSYGKKYSGLGSKDLSWAAGFLEDGEEKEWLNSYASQKAYTEKSGYDVAAGEAEVKDMEDYALWVINELKPYSGYQAEYNKRAKELWSKYGVSNAQEMQDLINEKKQYVKDAARIQKNIALASVNDDTSEYYDPAFKKYADPSKLQGLDKTNLSREEQEIYSYYYNKYGAEKANEYLDSIMEAIAYRNAERKFSNYEGNLFLEQVFAVHAGIDQAFTGLSNLFSDKDYIPTSSTQYLSGMIREDLKDDGFKLPDWMGGASSAQVVYDLLNTSANMAPSIVAGSLANMVAPGSGAIIGAAMMGGSAAGNAYQEALNAGYDKDQARMYSTLVGASEAGLQYLMGGIGKLGGKMSGKAAKTLASKFNNAYARLAVQYGTNMLSEGAEEYLQEVLTPVFKNLAFGTDEDVELLSEEAIYSFLLGALTSGFMETSGISSDTGKSLPGHLIDMSSLNKKNKQAVELYGDVTSELVQEGLESDSESEAHELAEIFQRKLDKGKKLSGYEIRQQVGANDEIARIQTELDATNEAAKRLKELGETSNVGKIATLVAKNAMGQKLTDTEKSTLVRSKYGSQVAKEMRDAVSQAEKTAYKPLEERVDTETPAKVSDTGKAVISGTDQQVDLTAPKIKKITADSVILEVDGKDVDMDSIEFANEDQWNMFNALKKIEHITPAVASDMIAKVDTSKPIWDQLNGMDEAFTYGYWNYSEADLNAGMFATYLTNQQMNDAYKMGQYARRNEVGTDEANRKRMRTEAEAKLSKNEKAAQQKARIESDDVDVYFMDGETVEKFGDRKGYNEKRIAAVNTAKFLRKLGIGGKFVFYESYEKNGKRYFKDKNGVERPAPNGFYDQADGTIYIDLNAGNDGSGKALFTMGHELAHFVKHRSEKQFKILSDMVAEAFDKTSLSMHQRVLRKQAFLQGIRGNTEKVSYTEAYEEVVADAMSTMLTDGSFYDTLMEIKVKHKDLFATIKKFFTDMIAKFKQEYANIAPDQQDAIDIRELKNAFDKIQKAFAEGLVEASENFQAAENTTEAIENSDEIAYSKRGYQRVFFKENVFLPFNESHSEAHELAERWAKSEKTEAGERKLISYHNQWYLIESFEDLKYGYQIMKKLTKQQYIKEASHYGTVTGYQSLQDSLSEDAAQHYRRGADGDAGYRSGNDASQHRGKNRAVHELGENKVRWETSERNGTRNLSSGSLDSQGENGSAVRNSDRDSQGNNLSEEQQEFFKNSKIVDANGNLKVMYHGSQESFTVFDKKKARSSGYYGKGFYFTDSNSHAKQYGNAYEVYLNITHPLQHGTKDITKEQFRKFVEAIAENEDYGLDNYGERATVDSVTNSVYGKGDFAMLMDINASCVGDLVEAVELFNEVNGTDYDGIIAPTETVAFYPEQIKRTDNKTPTSNPDMRYSERNTETDQTDIHSRIFNLQSEEGRLNRSIKEIEDSEDFKSVQDRMFNADSVEAGVNQYLEWKEKSGYGALLAQRDSVRDELKKLREERDNNYADESAEKERQAIAKSGLSEAEYFRKQAVNEFGYTPYFYDAGYLTPNGKMLNFSGEKGKHFGSRGEDHRAIGIIYENTQGSDAMVRFMNDGNIRIMAETPGLDISSLVEPTKEQYAQIRKFARENGSKEQYFAVDISDENGRVIGNYEYDGYVNADRVVNDIKYFFEHGEVREQSSVARFLNSDRNYERDLVKQDRAYLDAVNRGDTETAQKMVDEAAKKAGYTIKAYHGTRHGGFTVFDDTKNDLGQKGFFFSDSPEVAKSYFKGSDGSLYSEYIRMDNPLVIDGHRRNWDALKFDIGDDSKAYEIKQRKDGYWEIFNIEGRVNIGKQTAWDTKESAEQAYRNAPWVHPTNTILNTTRAIVRYAYNKGEYDGAIIKNTIDMGDSRAKRRISTLYIPFNPEQIKSTDPITYDGNGNVIPLSQRFHAENDDIRYSERGEDSSNRSLLANAFEGITRDSIEYEMIQEYKSHIKDLNALDKELGKINAEIREIRFTKGKYDAKKLSALERKAKAIANEITRHDRELLSLEASEPLRKVIERERKKEAQKTKAHVQEIQQNKKVRAEQTELRHKIRKTIRDLDKILNRGNKKLNVKEDLQPVVTKALRAAEILFTDNYNTYDMLRNGLGVDLSDSEEALVDSCTKMLKDLDKMPTDGYENFQARQEAENRLRTKMSKLKDVFARERKRLNNTTVSSILGELADAYASLEKSEQSYVQGAYSEPVHNFLKNLQSEVGGTIVMDMTKDQLESVYAAYKMVLTTVRKANQMFNEELKQSREQLGNAVIEEVLKAGGVHLLGTKMGDAVSQFDWNNMKPVWVGNRIGSESFAKLWQGLFEGQYNFARDIDEVKKFKLEMDKKYNPRKWDAEKQYEFESTTGKKFSLNLQQIMSLYAFSKREQAYSHLLNGGFVFEDNSTVVVDGKLGIKKTYIHKGAASYKLNEATLNGIINSLTKEQKAYVDQMQKYLSDVMGAKGNEVSMQLYGIQMFKEKFYFPLRSSGAYMERAKEAELKKQQGQINLVNSGFTHSVKPEAKNPIVLSGFMDVWAEHCNEMSMYHSMVLPMEDFRKVYNYTTIHDEKMESASVYQTIQDAYGKAATGYIDQLYRELNAGATVDPRETPWKKLISNFKKSAVMLSGSVVVQQFSSIGRAYAVIDPKYFIGTKVNSDTKLATVEEMKKYAPVAIIKEMGGFDTGTKGNATAYIKAEKYGKGEFLKGFKKDAQYRGDIMGMLPAKADELTWCAIWEAVKRETKANHPKMDVKSEEFLKLAGERFSEVIEKTQVYDSVLARSANMRSKGNFMAMATAFMAEPTTTINLIEDAIRSGKAKNIARVFGSVAVSIVLNNALASIVYAMRDDDEDETFLEKYFQSFTSGMIDDINPMSYYPFLKDVWSLFQGYDVERTDMAVIADVRDAMKQVYKYLSEDTSEMDDKKLAEHNKNLWGAFMSLLDAGCSTFGVPFKNIRRDANGLINAWNTVSKDLSGERDNSWLSFWDKVGAAAKDTIPFLAWTKDAPKADKLYEAIVSGDKAYINRLKVGYVDKDGNFDQGKYDSAVVKALRENDPRIHAAAQANVNGNARERNHIFNEIKAEGKFSASYIIDAINAEASAIRNEGKPDKVAGQYGAYDFVEAVSTGDAETAKAVREDIIETYKANGKTQAAAEQAFEADVKSGIKEAYSYGDISKSAAENMLVEYAGMDKDDATDKITYWDFIKTNPSCDLSESKVLNYLEFAEPTGVALDVYEQFVADTKDLADIKDKWGDVEVTKREQVLEVIDSLPLSWQQKDALYLAYGYAESKIWDVPW